MEPVDLSVKTKGFYDAKGAQDLSLHYTNDLLKNEKTIHKPYCLPDTIKDVSGNKVHLNQRFPHEELFADKYFRDDCNAKVNSFIYPNPMGIYPTSSMETIANSFPLHRIPTSFPIPLPLPFTSKLPFAEFQFPLPNALVNQVRTANPQLPVIVTENTSQSPKRKLPSPASESGFKKTKLLGSHESSSLDKQVGSSTDNLSRAISSIPPEIDITVVHSKNVSNLANSPVTSITKSNFSNTCGSESLSVVESNIVRNSTSPFQVQNSKQSSDLSETSQHILKASPPLPTIVPKNLHNDYYASNLLIATEQNHALESFKRNCLSTAEFKPWSMTSPQVYTDAKMNQSTCTTYTNTCGSPVKSCTPPAHQSFIPSPHGIDLTYSKGS